MSDPTALPLTERQSHLMHGIRRDGGDWSPARARDHLACCGYDATTDTAHQIMKTLAGLGHLEQVGSRARTYRLKPTPPARIDDALAATFLAAWTATQQLWLTSRQGAMPHQIAGCLAEAHAAIDRAVSEAERAGVAVVERDRGGHVTAIRAAEGGVP
jgi:hypothetical protein